MRLHACTAIDARAWWHCCAPARVQLQIGVVRYSATVEEARLLAAELGAAADAVEKVKGDLP